VRAAAIHANGLLLFLFIPVVLFLFVRHPQPVAGSLALGVALMLGHRFLARPFMERVRTVRCIWCAHVLADGEAHTAVEVKTSGGPVPFTACTAHAVPAGRFFAWLDRWRLPLRLGIGVPLVLLLVALSLTAAGLDGRATLATEVFRLIVGCTVEVAALGSLLGTTGGTPSAAFPLHNFTLLGVRNLLWIFRLVGIWWIVGGAAALLHLAAG